MQSVCKQLGNWVVQAKYFQYEKDYSVLQREWTKVFGG